MSPVQDEHLSEMCAEDKSYIGQLTKDELEDKDQLAEKIGERLMKLQKVCFNQI